MAKKNRKKSTFFSDFKAFITKGNIIDMAVGVIIGGAFSAIVNSLVNDIIMPLLTRATGKGVQGMAVVLNGVSRYLEDGSPNPAAILWNYGNFIQTIINFLIIAICIFTTLRIIMNIKKASEKLVDKAKNSIKGNGKAELQQEEAQEVAQEAVADVAEEVKADDTTAVEESQALAEVVEAVEEVAEQKETQEELLKQIRDLLVTMQPKQEEKTPVNKTATKPAAKKTVKSAK